MADNERDYNLTEAQKVIKAKYPPLNKKYECEYCWLLLKIVCRIGETG